MKVHLAAHDSEFVGRVLGRVEGTDGGTARRLREERDQQLLRIVLTVGERIGVDDALQLGPRPDDDGRRNTELAGKRVLETANDRPRRLRRSEDDVPALEI